MQRVSSLLPSWERTRSVDGKAAGAGGALGKVFGSWTDKMASPKRLSTGNSTSSPVQPAQAPMGKTGREAYWPTTLDKECEKAARILKSFCTDGFLSNEPNPTTNSEPTSPTTATTATAPPPPPPAGSTEIMKKIPPRIVQNAVGLAIFSCMRSGLWMSGSGGSGILIARKADGTWSPPSGIILHTAGLGFAIGVDIYDCVLVINSVTALEMFTRPRLVLGSDVLLSVGPVASVCLTENDPTRWKDLGNTVLTYLKARGQHRAVRLDGSMVTERGNENERFYGTTVDVLEILAGAVPKSIPEIAPLFEAIKAAEGRTDYDVRVMQQLSQQPAPGDATIETPTISPATPMSATFGLPSVDDPDPFGIIALEMAGLEIREAGTRMRPTSTQFDYCPSPTSPSFVHTANVGHSTFHRQSVDTYASHSNSNRGSYMSSRTQATTMTDAFTQTDVGESARASPSPRRGSELKGRPSSDLPVVREPEEIDYTKIDMTALERLNRRESVDFVSASAPATPSAPSATAVAAVAPHPASVSDSDLPRRQGSETSQSTAQQTDLAPVPAAQESERDDDADDEDDEDDDDDEEPVIFEVATASQPTRAAIMTTQVTQVISANAKGALVTIPKRVPPALPPRNPARSSRASKSDFGGDVSSLKSPTRSSFESAASSIPKEEEEEQQQQSAADDATLTPADQTTATLLLQPVSPVVGASSDGAGDDCATSTRGFSHHRNTSSVYTTIISLQDDVASTPTKDQHPSSPHSVVVSTPTIASTTSQHQQKDEEETSSISGRSAITAPEHVPADDDECTSSSTATSVGEPLTPRAFEEHNSHHQRQLRSDDDDDEERRADQAENESELGNDDVEKITPNHLNAGATTTTATIQVA